MILFIIPLALGIWVGIDASKRGMNAPMWGIFTCLLLIIGLPLYLIERNKYPYKTNPANSSTIVADQTPANSNDHISIPHTCPHCKNPNTKKIRLCEWCGSQII